MAWMEPKTNWANNDYFNTEDYNRMIGNLSALKEMADKLFIGIRFIDMGYEKSIEDHIYAREFNAIENNLRTLNLASYKINTTFRTYRDNGLTPSYEDYNRIERTMLELYNKINNQKENLTRLAFTLGGQKGIRV